MKNLHKINSQLVPTYVRVFAAHNLGRAYYRWETDTQKVLVSTFNKDNFDDGYGYQDYIWRQGITFMNNPLYKKYLDDPLLLPSNLDTL